jgi:uncharacterized protein YodC (DUF2158 family)
MANEFVAGDMVQLKSGGEVMTVEKVDGDNISVVWQQNKKVEWDTFLAVTLDKYTGPAWGAI